MNDPIPIEVNGEPRHAPAGTTVADLISQLGLPLERIAIELNRTLLPRASFSRTLVADDHLEIVTFVGGG